MRRLWIAVLTSLLLSGASRAADLTLLVGFPPGQGPDVASSPDVTAIAGQRLSADPTFEDIGRFYADRLGQFLPDHPHVTMKLLPGAAGLLAARKLLAETSVDATTIALLGPSAVLAPLARPANAPWRPDELAWIGALRRDDDACVARADRVGTFEAGFDRTRLFAATLAPGSRSYVYARALNLFADLRLKIVSGYAGEFEITRALEIGEANVWCGGTISGLRRRYGDLMREGVMRAFLRFSVAPPEEGLDLRRADELPDDPADRDAMWAISSQTRFGAFALAASPSTAPTRLNDLRSAYLAMARDPETLRLAGARGFDVDPVSGADLQTLAGRLAGLSARARDRLAQALFDR